MDNKKPDFFFFSERTSNIDPKKFDFKKCHDGTTWWLEYLADMHFFDVLNRNERGYLHDNIREHVYSPKNMDMMARDAWFGEADHPFAMNKDETLSKKRVEKVLWNNRTHKNTKPVFTKDKLTMTLQTCSGTEVGRGHANDIIQGMIPAYSCRSCGHLDIIKGMPIVIVSKIITYDSVPFSGFEGASMVSNPVKKEAGIVCEEGPEKPVKSKNSFVQIPYDELLDDITPNDARMYAYMESTDGDIAIEGLTEDGKLHINNRGLHIFAGIDNHSLDMVKDFYRSFK